MLLLCHCYIDQRYKNLTLPLFLLSLKVLTKIELPGKINLPTFSSTLVFGVIFMQPGDFLMNPLVQPSAIFFFQPNPASLINPLITISPLPTHVCSLLVWFQQNSLLPPLPQVWFMQVSVSVFRWVAYFTAQKLWSHEFIHSFLFSYYNSMFFTSSSLNPPHVPWLLLLTWWWLGVYTIDFWLLMMNMSLTLIFSSIYLCSINNVIYIYNLWYTAHTIKLLYFSYWCLNYPTLVLTLVQGPCPP